MSCRTRSGILLRSRLARLQRCNSFGQGGRDDKTFMNILFISAILPYPLHSGGQVRLYNLLKLLSKDHEITLYSFIRNESERELVSRLSFLKSIHLFYRGHVWQPKYLFRALTSDMPLLLSSYENQAMKQAIAKDATEHHYDILHLEPFYVWPSIPERVQIPIVVAEHNIEYEVYQAYARQTPIPFIESILKNDVQKIKKYEEFVWKKANSIITVSDHDASIPGCVTDKKKIAVVPNGVDTTYFSFQKKKVDNRQLKFLFTGNFLWMPNMKAVEILVKDIWPGILKQFPKAQLTIVGKHLPKHMKNSFDALHISYQAFVDDIRKEYHQHDILLAPMTISGGTKFKVLEAFASGCLVLTTKEGIEGIDAKEGVMYLRSDTPASYISNIQMLVEHSKRFEQITKQARRLIEEKYSWDAIAEKQSSVWKQSV